jgi:flagellar protein FlbD
LECKVSCIEISFVIPGLVKKMILVTRFNGSKFYINAELIQTVEETPSTVITLVDHTRLVVADSAAAIVEKVIEYRQKISLPLQKSGDLK